MAFQNFELEHYQSQFEHRVEFNLADSSVEAVTLREWLDEDEIARVLDTKLSYSEVNGTVSLRRAIAALYPDASAEHVLVTVGCAEANALVCATLLEPGDEVVVMAPGYRQVWGLAVNAGCLVHEARLQPEAGWRFDLDAFGALVARRPRLVSITNPNNPTGTILSDEERTHVVAACRASGAWLHVDEVYSGTELDGVETPSFWGGYDRLVCTNSLSKAYGLAGLRVGWVVASPDVIEALWRRHEYAVIAASGPSMVLAEVALSRGKRAGLLERQRRLSIDGREVLAAWVATHDRLVSWTPPPATSMGFVRCQVDLPSSEVAERVRRHASVLVAPGSALGLEHYLRITAGYPVTEVRKALDRVGRALDELAR